MEDKSKFDCVNCAALTEQFLSNLPDKATILSFDVRSYWTKLEQLNSCTIKKKCKSSFSTNAEDDEQQVPSPPLSPVISTFNDFRTLKNVCGNKTSTPLNHNLVDRKSAKPVLQRVSENQASKPLVRRSLEKENCLFDHYDAKALQHIIDVQHKISKYMKDKDYKKIYQVCDN